MQVDDVVLLELAEHFNLSHRGLLHDLIVVRLLEFLNRNWGQGRETSNISDLIRGINTQTAVGSVPSALGGGIKTYRLRPFPYFGP